MSAYIRKVILVLLVLAGLQSCKEKDQGRLIKLVVTIDREHGMQPGASENRSHLIEETYKVVVRRLKPFATDTIIASLDAKQGVIKVQLHSKDSFERLKSVLIAEGRLEMFEAFGNADVLVPLLMPANDSLAAMFAGSVKQAQVPKPKIKQDSSDHASIDEYMSGEANSPENAEAERKNPLFSVMFPSLNKTQDAPYEGPVVGYTRPQDRARLNTLLAAVKNIFPKNMRFLYGRPEGDTAAKVLPVYAVRVPDNGVASIGNEDISHVQEQPDEITNLPSILMNMTAAGTAKWSRMTLRQMGSYIVVAYDGEVVSAPRVMDRITTGNTEIMGGFTERTAKNIAAILAGGRLPMHIKVVEDRGGQ